MAPPKPPTTAQLAFSDDLQLHGTPTTSIPRLVYGTAWKKERTADLVYQALKCGFRGVDTAAQPKHYREDLVGDGIRRAIADGITSRGQIYIQTKFTPPSGQDLSNMPYDADASLEKQITASVQSSLRNLETPGEEPYIDCLVLHSPLESVERTMAAFKFLQETYVPQKIHHLGISNVPAQFVPALGPQRLAVVQNRFIARTDYEVSMRSYCRANGIIFQTFWTLTGNPELVQGRVVSKLQEAAGLSREVAFYSLVLGLEGTTILDGTTSEEHMREDLAGIGKCAAWAAGEGRDIWLECLTAFKDGIGESD